ncbi:MAG: aldose epimerase family protein [Bacteroidota bacterium]
MKKCILNKVILFLSLIIIGCSNNAKVEIMVEKSLYGKLPDGREVYQFTLKNNSGMQAKIINYGAIVRSIIVPDRNGKFEDVTLGYDSLSGYVQDKSYQGAIVGRYGNRIGKGKFKLDGKEYQLALNDGENHLHGGNVGFHKVLWDAKVVSDTGEPSLALTYFSPDGEEGYPGNVTISVTYTLTNKNELRIDYYGTTDKPTILNPTHHSYFNLTGNPANTILDHQLIIEADAFTPVDKGLITTGEKKSVDKTPLDFRTPAAIGARINDNFEQLIFGKGYDHNWVLRNFDRNVNKAVELYEPVSGRVMTIFTDQPGMQFYSGNFLDGSIKGKNGISYQYRTGLCLEAQYFPDSPNKPDFPSVTLYPGQEYKQTTIYHFSIK